MPIGQPTEGQIAPTVDDPGRTDRVGCQRKGLARPSANTPEQTSHCAASDVSGILLVYLTKWCTWPASHGLTQLICSGVNLGWILSRSR